MKLHEIKARVEQATALPVFDANSAVQVVVTGDQPNLVPVIGAKLSYAGIPYTKSKHRKFKGAIFTIPLRNVGTAFAADWEFAR